MDTPTSIDVSMLYKVQFRLKMILGISFLSSYFFFETKEAQHIKVEQIKERRRHIISYQQINQPLLSPVLSSSPRITTTPFRVAHQRPCVYDLQACSCILEDSCIPFQPDVPNHCKEH
ncbi:uncharacterized protein DS421_16g525210 [Arachis hypogaea]|nr:uncharacterized protein DS421_16g525210 [Arachis hypogaea]